MSFPGARRVAGWLFWVVFPLLCLAAVALSVSNIASHIGKKPDGIRGTFVVTPRSCNQGICSFGGLFTSDDGTIKNLPLLGDPRWHPPTSTTSPMTARASRSPRCPGTGTRPPR